MSEAKDPWGNLVLVEFEDGIAWVTMNRPEKKNAMSPALNEEMLRTVVALSTDERCKVLVHLIDGTQDDVKAAYTTIRGELSAYSGELADKPEIVVLNKADALDEAAVKAKRRALEKLSGAEVLVASGATGKGVEAVLYRVLGFIDAERAGRAEAVRREARPGWTP